MSKYKNLDKATIDELVKIKNETLQFMMTNKTLDANSLNNLAKYVRKINYKIEKLDEKNKNIFKDNDYLDLF